MKRLLLIALLLLAGFTTVQAQNDTTFYVVPEFYDQTLYACSCDEVILYALEGCESFHWQVGYNTYYDLSYITIHSSTAITFSGCGYYIPFYVQFSYTHVPNETTTTLWKHQHEATTLQPVSSDSLEWYPYEFLWSTGETTALIDVTEPGTYTCDIMDCCGTATRTFIVRDNVEIYRSTVDLETNLNKVTWQVTAEQAEYINQVKVERDGFVVGTVPYGQGYFLDNIGSENAARNYRLTAIDTDGNECPIPSYQKGTLHVDYSPNASNPNKLNMAWTAPFIEEGAPVAVTYFQICKYDPNTHEITVVDQLSANNTIGSYDINLFEGGYATVAALFNDAKDYDNVSFSNLTDEILGIGEVWGTQFRVYPNPSNGKITVEGNGMLSIRNVLGQEILTKEIENSINLELSKGIYFLKMNGKTQKVVVE